MSRRLIVTVVALVSLLMGATVWGSTAPAPVDELEYITAESGDTYRTIVSDLGLSCSPRGLWEANGRTPVRQGLIVLIPTICQAEPSTTSTTVAPTTSVAASTTTVAPSTTTAQAPSTTVAPTTTDPTALMPIYQPIDGCADGDVVPLGQASAARNFEPLGSIWCFELDDPPARTAVEGENSWVDDFTVDELMLSLDDGEMGYRVYNQAGQRPGQSQHWINQNHWMVDAKEGFTGGASMRPDRSFSFENGKFVVEGDFAAGIPEYGQDTWGEITITSAPEPTGVYADNIYAYGQFGGDWSVGCRLTSKRKPICAIEGPTADTPPDGQCFSRPGNYRVSEMSWFQRCGSEVMGGNPFNGRENYWRECEPNGPDMACRDRFRMEVTKDSLTLYVNGIKYFEDARWPAAHQLPDSFINGDIYVYQSNWQNRAGSRAYRYHWDHFAVNPPSGPTASDSFE